MKKKVINEKIDILYSIILVLIFLILMLVGKLLNFNPEWTGSILFAVGITVSTLPQGLRRKKQYKRIDDLRKSLNLSIEEIRNLADIGKYDLNEWKWDKSFISQKQLYVLEDALEKMYFKEFGKEF